MTHVSLSSTFHFQSFFKARSHHAVVHEPLTCSLGTFQGELGKRAAPKRGHLEGAGLEKTRQALDHCRGLSGTTGATQKHEGGKHHSCLHPP